MDDIKALLHDKGILVGVGLALLIVLIFMVIASVYVGAIIHAVAEVYVDETPNALKSLTYGCSTIVPLYINNIIYTSSIILVGAISVGIPVVGLLSDNDDGDDNDEKQQQLFIAFLGCLIFFVVALISSLLFTAAAPAIVIEKASAVGAFMRSVRLCKRDLCALFLIAIVVGIINIFAGILNTIFATSGIPNAISQPIINFSVLVYGSM